MQFFVDTAEIADIKKLYEMGLLDGVTTNPSLVAKSGRDFKEVIKEICGIVPGPVSAEVAATEYDGMIAEGKVLAKIADNVVVKLPLTVDGLRASKTFTNEGIKTNVTLCFSPNQALLAAKVGATYISPFIGRLDDINLEGMELIEQIRTDLRQLRLRDRNPRGLDPLAQPRHPGRAGRRRRGDHPAAGHLQARRPPADQVAASSSSSKTGSRPASRSSSHGRLRTRRSGQSRSGACRNPRRRHACRLFRPLRDHRHQERRGLRHFGAAGHGGRVRPGPRRRAAGRRSGRRRAARSWFR